MAARTRATPGEGTIDPDKVKLIKELASGTGWKTVEWEKSETAARVARISRLARITGDSWK